MTRIFFSHASEDKSIIEAIYGEFVTAYPEHELWVDKYEIVGGDSLITKIADGMDQADKFFIFLSPISVSKPWVQRELRRALMREIEGVDPNYIVPVKIGDLDKLPPFLEDKLYIDITRMQKQEWLAQFDAAINGEQKKPVAGTGNIDVIAEYADRPNIARITFTARAWAEEFSWGVVTAEDIEAADVQGSAVVISAARLHEPRFYAQKVEKPELRPGQPVTLFVHFQEGVDALAAIKGVQRWEPVSAP